MMTDGWLAFTYVSIFVVVGAVVAVWLNSHAAARRWHAVADAERRYDDLVSAQSASNEGLVETLDNLDARLRAIESLLRDVG